MKSKKQNLISAFDDLLGPPIEDEIPEGFKSIAQLAEDRHLDDRTIGRKLSKLLAAQKVIRRQFRNSNGRVCWFYRVR